ncbi:unnamed protein product [Caenorhabditis nigoni]
MPRSKGTLTSAAERRRQEGWKTKDYQWYKHSEFVGTEKSSNHHVTSASDLTFSFKTTLERRLFIVKSSPTRSSTTFDVSRDSDLVGVSLGISSGDDFNF